MPRLADDTSRVEFGQTGFPLGPDFDAVVDFVATGGYTGPATPALRRKIIPIGSFVIASEPLPEHLVRALIPHQRMVFDYRHFLNYFRLWDQRLIFGGRAARRECSTSSRSSPTRPT